MRSVEIHFLGAAGTVTGSKYLLKVPGMNILVDCGLFQGLKELRQKNWARLPIDPAEIDLVLLTHGHLDHTGYLPRLVNLGFRGKILGTAPTLALADVILRDSGKIQEEEAKKANLEGYSKHDPAMPLYTVEQAQACVSYFSMIDTGEWLELAPELSCRFSPNGHIIGSTFIELDIFGKRFVFSGDVGRLEDHLLEPPQRPAWADYLFLESTYGDRMHPQGSLTQKLSQLIDEVIGRRGTLIIPSFAVERLQVLMYLLWKLYRQRRIPNIAVYVDSPMGNKVTEIFRQFPQWHKLKINELEAIEDRINIITSYRETWETIDDPRPKIVIAGSGMVTGGRVLTYLQQLIDKDTTDILLVGFQAEGTRGRDLLEGAKRLRFYGKVYDVRARVHHVESLSAHADQAELLDWLSDIRNIPEQVFLVHGEPAASAALKNAIEERFKWRVEIPKLYAIETVIV